MPNLFKTFDLDAVEDAKVEESKATPKNKFEKPKENRVLITTLNGEIMNNGTFYVYTNESIFRIRDHIHENAQLDSYNPIIERINYKHNKMIVKMWWFSHDSTIF